jgi:hypothetical protein
MNNPIKYPEKHLDKDPIDQPEPEVDEERQIIIHCSCASQSNSDSWIRIWKTTFLIDQNSGFQSDLLFAYNITFYPDWDLLPSNSSKKFTLLFGGLPKSCRIFDLIEVTDDTGEFESKGIIRNMEDVYYALF